MEEKDKFAIAKKHSKKQRHAAERKEAKEEEKET